MPEFRHVAGGIAVLGTETRTERVDFPERGRRDLALELPRDGEPRPAPEEVVRIVFLAGMILVRVADCRHLEHFARTLAVAPRDERRVDIHIAALLEEAVDRRRHDRPHAEHRVEGIGADAQMRRLAERLELLELLLQGIIRRAVAEDVDSACVDLHAAPVLRLDHRTDDAERRAEVRRRRGRRECRLIDDDLHMLQRRAVVEFDKCHVLGVARRADPAADRDRRADRDHPAGDLPNIRVLHLLGLLFF